MWKYLTFKRRFSTPPEQTHHTTHTNKPPQAQNYPDRENNKNLVKLCSNACKCEMFYLSLQSVKRCYESVEILTHNFLNVNELAISYLESFQIRVKFWWLRLCGGRRKRITDWNTIAQIDISSPWRGAGGKQTPNRKPSGATLKNFFFKIPDFNF